MRIQVLSIACDVISFNGQGQLCQPTCEEWRDLSNHTTQGDPRKRQKTMSHWPEHFHENLVPLPTYLSFLKTFPTKMKPSKCPAREKKWGKKSQKGGEERKRKVKVKSAVSLFNPKPVSKFYFLRMPELRKLMGLHLDQKAAKCTTCKRLCGKFYLFTAKQWPENHSTSFKTCFSAKSSGANGLSCMFCFP